MSLEEVASQHLAELRHVRGLWQHTRGSALIGFIKDDAEFIAAKIAEYQQSKRPAGAGTPVDAGATSETARAKGANGA